ncbi:MAG: cupin domain-containing protein [Sphingobium sp.]|uniref:cupin domain-containing protein n=1 Tax=Sphingobium sp. TaxID=1912891 RepID=UPI0029A9DFDE|nr:cupin domain-containing protein [Sphingobium sp.]MDX3911573.1 cupin domain-containing protein [Sphingobium sp.]
MPTPDPVSNARVDSLLGADRPPIEAVVCGLSDLNSLRAAWSKAEAVPVIVPSTGDIASTGWAGFDIHTLLRSEQAAGRFTAHRFTLAPGTGIAPHYHADAHTYIVLTGGEAELQIGRLVENVGPYTLGYAPPLTRHGFRNRSNRPSDLILVHAPAGADLAFKAAAEHWRETGDAGEKVYQEILGRFGFNFDDVVLANDALTNQLLPPFEFEFSGEGDLDRVREMFERRPGIPRLVTITTEQMSDKPTGTTYRNEVIRGDDTAGHGMINFLAGGPGMNAPPHYQPTEDEFFFILDGSLQMTCAGATIDLEPGAMVFCPRNCTHGFVNVNESTDSRFFTLNAPAGHERAMEAVRKLLKNGGKPEEIDRLSQAGGFIFKRLPKNGKS